MFEALDEEDGSFMDYMRWNTSSFLHVPTVPFRRKETNNTGASSSLYITCTSPTITLYLLDWIPRSTASRENLPRKTARLEARSTEGVLASPTKATQLRVRLSDRHFFSARLTRKQKPRHFKLRTPDLDVRSPGYQVMVRGQA